VSIRLKLYFVSALYIKKPSTGQLWVYSHSSF